MAGSLLCLVNVWCRIGGSFGVLGVKVGLYGYMYKSRTHSWRVADAPSQWDDSDR